MVVLFPIYICTYQIKKQMTNKIFQDSEGTLALVREWARGRTQQLAEAFGCHPNTLYAQYKGFAFNEGLWNKTQKLMKEERVKPSVRRLVLRYVMRNITLKNKAIMDKLVLDGKDIE